MKKIIFLIVCMLSVSCSKQDPTPKTVSTPDNGIVPMDHPRKSTRMVTVQHDGHWFLVLGEHFTHHIDCPCKKALENE
jgi:hypothetical protein